ncbi:unnamed protein product, partial [Symbiodinium sp. KB8]
REPPPLAVALDTTQLFGLSQSALDPRAAFMGGSESVVYKDLLALLSVAFENQRNVIHQQRSRMDRLLAEFADIRQELEEDPELQMLYAEVRRQRRDKDGSKKKKKTKKTPSCTCSALSPSEPTLKMHGGCRLRAGFLSRS